MTWGLARIRRLEDFDRINKIHRIDLLRMRGGRKHFNELGPWMQAQKNEDVLKARTKVRQIVGDRDPTLRVPTAHTTRT
jgi:hypothetical protein